MMDASKQIEFAEAQAKERLLETGGYAPLIAGFRDGKCKFVVSTVLSGSSDNNVGTPEEKNMMAVLARVLLAYHACTSYTFSADSWMRTTDEKGAREHMQAGKGVSDYSDKVEAVIISYEDQDGMRVSRATKYTRDANGKVVSFDNSENFTAPKGRFSFLLPRKGYTPSDEFKRSLKPMLRDMVDAGIIFKMEEKDETN